MSTASLMKAVDEWNHLTEVVTAIEIYEKNRISITGPRFHSMVMASLASPRTMILPSIENLRKRS